jgi:hypothetical protein
MMRTCHCDAQGRDQRGRCTSRQRDRLDRRAILYSLAHTHDPPCANDDHPVLSSRVQSCQVPGPTSSGDGLVSPLSKALDPSKGVASRILHNIMSVHLPHGSKVQRSAACSWLLCLVKYAGEDATVQGQLTTIQESFSACLTDSHQFTQECASKVVLTSSLFPRVQLASLVSLASLSSLPFLASRRMHSRILTCELREWRFCTRRALKRCKRAWSNR